MATLAIISAVKKKLHECCQDIGKRSRATTATIIRLTNNSPPSNAVKSDWKIRTNPQILTNLSSVLTNSLRDYRSNLAVLEKARHQGAQVREISRCARLVQRSCRGRSVDDADDENVVGTQLGCFKSASKISESSPWKLANFRND